MNVKQFCRKIWWPAAIVALPILFSGAALFSMTAYATFQAMSLSALQTLQVKLTYVGPRKDIIPSVAFTSTSNSVDLTKFTPFQRPDVDYSADTLALNTFQASTAELKAVIDDVGSLPHVTAGGEDPSQYLSFAMVNPPAGNAAFEAVLNQSDAAALFGQLRLALQNNKLGLRRLADLACQISLLDPQRPTDVSSQFGIALSGLRLNRATGRFVGTATLTNNTGSGVTGPISLVLDLPGNVTLFNADGTTCGTSPVGRGFINAPLTGNTLPTGATAQVQLDFANPDSEPIKPTTKVLAGPGAR